MTERGWYPDPDPRGGPGQLRWWDGSAWTADTTPAQPGAAPAPAGAPEAGMPPLGPPSQPPAPLFPPPAYLPPDASWVPAPPPLGPPPQPQQPRSGMGRGGQVLIAAAVVVALAVVGTVVALTRNGGEPLVDAAARQSATSAAPTPSVSTGAAAPSSSASRSTAAAPRSSQPSKPATTPKPVPGCPAAAAPAGGNVTVPTKPGAGPRVYDNASGVSYVSPGQPWLPFAMGPWATKGAVATFRYGFYLISDRGTPTGDYYATVLSGTVPAPAGGGTSCLAEEIAADIRIAFYPFTTTRTNITAKPVVVGKYGGYVVQMKLGISAPGYPETSELVGVLVINNGKPHLPVMYISLPSTVSNYNYLVDQTFGSVQVL